ncbi:helix-turn-helix transcriptional regulator [Zavarzinia compransoris]|uniref:winged helix-turn-helix transcriptional regulator n=1 Tax=Zavarzinia marina TaxID=2911065 RepID=UPI001F4230B2|nr:helix-turn-helix domain-containing protein [Zavarzinia marina]MCF4165395.1 helix-turn-helix transcriptional regulator [Zavarzinia marina]
MTRNSLAEKNCSLARALDVVGEWWSLLLVREAFFGTRRFQDFAANLGIARNILSNRLKRLVTEGVLARMEGAGGAVEYTLTRKGEALLPVLVTLMQWGDAHANDDPPPVILTDRATGTPLPPVEVLAADGRILTRTDIRAMPGPGADIPLRDRLLPRQSLG